MARSYLSRKDTKRVRTWQRETAEALHNGYGGTDEAKGCVVHDEYASINPSEPQRRHEREQEPAVAKNAAAESGGADLGRNHERMIKAKKHLKKGTKVAFWPISKPVKAILWAQKHWAEWMWPTIEAAVQKYEEERCYKIRDQISDDRPANRPPVRRNKDCEYQSEHPEYDCLDCLCLGMPNTDRTCQCRLQDLTEALKPQAFSAPASLDKVKAPEAESSFSKSRSLARQPGCRRPHKIRRVVSCPAALPTAAPDTPWSFDP